MTSPIPRITASLYLAALIAGLLIAVVLIVWNPLARRSWIRAAEASIRHNDFTTALDAVNQALVVEPDDPALLRLRGRVYMYLYEWDHAQADYDRALELAPADPALFYDRAVLFYTRLDLDRALADFQQVIALSPTDPMSAQAANYIAAIQAQQSALSAP